MEGQRWCKLYRYRATSWGEVRVRLSRGRMLNSAAFVWELYR